MKINFLHNFRKNSILHFHSHPSTSPSFISPFQLNQLSASSGIWTRAPSLRSLLSSPLSQLDMLVKTSELSTFVLGIAIDEKCNQINLPNFGKNVQMVIMCLFYMASVWVLCVESIWRNSVWSLWVGILCTDFVNEFSIGFLKCLCRESLLFICEDVFRNPFVHWKYLIYKKWDYHLCLEYMHYCSLYNLPCKRCTFKWKAGTYLHDILFP